MPTVFVVKLTGYYGAAILPQQTLHLRENLPVQCFHYFQEPQVFTSAFYTLYKEPVRNATTPNFSMTERTETHYHRHLFLLADLEKTAQIALPTPIKLIFYFLYMIPEYIGSNYRHATLFYLFYF